MMARTKVAQRRAAAEDVCWDLLMMMALGGLEIPMEWRDYLHRSYGRWTDLAVETGILRGDNDVPSGDTLPGGPSTLGPPAGAPR